MKRIVLGCVLAVAFVLISCPRSDAQCLAISTWWFTDPIPYGFSYYAGYPGTFVYLIAAGRSGMIIDHNRVTLTCGPAQGDKETCPTCPSGGRPISLATGNTYIKENDISLPGLGGGLTLTRQWNSIWPPSQTITSVGIFGQNWRSTYEESIFMGNDYYIKYARGDGSYWSFGINGVNAFTPAAPANVAATLSQNATSWVLAFQNGEQRLFDRTSGLLTSIIDRNGNTTQISYDSMGRLATVTDPAGRHLYFNYPTGSLFYLVSSVTSDFGPTLTYSYNANGQLSQVTRPDLTTVNFTYNGSSQITQVTDSNGKVLETHTYDSTGHGLSSAQANGVNALTVTAPQ